MNYIKHVGVYVKDLELMTGFYKKAFGLIPLCENTIDTGTLYNLLYGGDNASAQITKLVTEYGRQQGQGDMLELVHVEIGENIRCAETQREIYDIGLSHISIGVDNIEETVAQILKYGGRKKTDILAINQRKCCFCTDPEGNVIEIIQ